MHSLPSAKSRDLKSNACHINISVGESGDRFTRASKVLGQLTCQCLSPPRLATPSVHSASNVMGRSPCITICGPKAEEILGCELKAKEYDLKRNILVTGKFGFCVQVHIDFGPRYDPGIGIFNVQVLCIYYESVLRSAKELRWITIAMYTPRDTNAVFADDAVKLDDISWFMSPERIVEIAKYEVFPAPDTAHLLSRELAISNGVSVVPGTHVKSAAHGPAFVKDGVRYPAMIKAAGRRGRRIRVVSARECDEEAFKRYIDESPTGQVFSEKALSGPGWKHVEVQIVDDATETWLPVQTTEGR
ncbi:hypothetical protein FIBSPDRAFT_951177 [Athelia psychrophila]|uniref:Carbamoyl phosphate synthase ATP-binding domain-containing protein n=1 Tax=Athelia psychrophila TaxID=1759441 RepID=A0A166MWZ5_9AGAM|nr:hypothetical protein FIBSPDRAFT_951177 [Fibularhizoctonia sp. CBS 109695]